MPWCCSICTDLFDSSKSIATTSCGHIFHYDCLRAWLKESLTCPECRQKVLVTKLVKLYPNDNSHNSSTPNIENNFYAVKAELIEKERELRILQKRNEDLTLYVAKAESEASSHYKKLCDLNLQLDCLSLQLKNSKALESKVEKLEKLNMCLNSENELLNDIKTIVNGTQNQVEEILKNYSSSADGDHTRKLATYCSILKREFDRIIDEKKELKSKLVHMKNLSRTHSSDKLQLRNIIEKKQKQISVLEKENKDLRQNKYSDSAPDSSNMQDCLIKTSISVNDFDNSPLSVKFTENQRKIDVIVLNSKAPNATISVTSNNKKTEIPCSSNSKYQEDSITRIGYDGFGGHGSVIMRSIGKRMIGKEIGKNKKIPIFSHSNSNLPKRKRST